ncbi:MAG TPA: flagellar FlbD family protein [Methylomirabilota bacterium]|jgi:flagellar protein FlbD|nr:flagellar FlbD family protein [Methylomirabilota bacterium]
MIKLTRLNNHPLVVNCDLIKSIENAPDTVLTLVTGDKIIVRESTEQILERVIEFRRAVLAGLAPSPADLPTVASPAPPAAVKDGDLS